MVPWPPKQPEPRLNTPLLSAVTAYIEDQGGGQGLFPTAIEGFNIVRSFQSMMPMRNIYRPSLCVVLEGPRSCRSATSISTIEAWNAWSSVSASRRQDELSRQALKRLTSVS